MMIVRAALASLACTLALSGVAFGQSEAQMAEAWDFSMHDAAFTMYHEIGHLLVGELELPVLGKEEDAADALAVVLLLNDQDDEIEAFNTLIDSADGWYFNAVNSTGSGVDDFSYYDEHSLDIQRAYAMVCMMVGKDPEGFSQAADVYELDQDRRDGCVGTYEQAYSAWTALLEPHQVTDEPGAEISVVYDDYGDYGEVAHELQSREVMEKAAALVSSRYLLPRPITFRATLCGQANAYYSPGDGEITYCYELAADMLDLYLTHVTESDDQGDEEAE